MRLVRLFTPTLLAVLAAMAASDPALSPFKSPLALKPRLASKDFQQALGSRPVARSAHFSVHFAIPSLLRMNAVVGASVGELSTSHGAVHVEPVDEVRTHLRVWRLGLVIPKKMARRSVTRSLIKHQARELWRLHASALEQATWISDEQPVCNWVLRLKAPLPKAEFRSAASEVLKQLVRAEILEVLAVCAKGPRKGKA